jgi:hypothetical protein
MLSRIKKRHMFTLYVLGKKGMFKIQTKVGAGGSCL